ncbi:Cacna1h [Symbiodinium natans]|uniref:Cacna1h protein n=1 Tax=Symbiodinium natans TaxID=878477 RepID=A0A812UM16_9DINO|nr:Cacna1h [Symbiodinium natans]
MAANRDEEIAGLRLLRDSLYTVEYALWCYVKRLKVLRDSMLVIDLFILICGFAELIMSTDGGNIVLENFSLLRILRIARIMRLLKLFRRFSYLKELRKLLSMATSCMRTLCWSFLFCFMVMTIWAMLMVDLVQPLILELGKAGEFNDCEQCLRAAASVMNANLLLFKTVIAGDGWGKIAVPVIEAYPATAVIFVGSLLTLVFGVLNLIVAVVVDTFAEAREKDVMNRAEEMETDIEMDKKFLQKIFDRVDEDGSGELTLSELIEGARKDAEFQSRLRVMDIDEADLQQLFQMIDIDDSGTVERDEFIQPLSRWVHDSKTAPRFIKYNLMRSLHEQEKLKKLTEVRFEQMNSHIQRIALSLGVRLERPSTRSERRGSHQKTSIRRSSSGCARQNQAADALPGDDQSTLPSPTEANSQYDEGSSSMPVQSAHQEPSMLTQSTQDLEQVGNTLDFSNFKDLYFKNRRSKQEDSHQLLEAVGPELPEPSGLPAEGLGDENLDGVLNSTLQAAEELVAEAASAALARAGYTLHLRLKAMLRNGSVDETQEDEDDGGSALSPRCIAGHMGPDPSQGPFRPRAEPHAADMPCQVPQQPQPPVPSQGAARHRWMVAV